MISIEMNRNDAECLVELLESCEEEKEGSWRFDLAAEIRHKFGMISREAEAALKQIVAKPYSPSELLDHAVHGKPLDPSRVIATYAEPTNWTQIYNGNGPINYKAKACEWAFIGGVRPPYELAQQALSASPDFGSACKASSLR